MAVSYCLPPKQVQDFVKAMGEGKIDVFKLQDMSSADRRSTLASIVGDDHAKEINTLFEQKLLLKYKFGLFDWVKQITTLTEDQRKSIVDKIEGLDERILNPANQKAFLADLAADKLGTNVTEAEAKEIFDLSKQAANLKTQWQQNLSIQIPRSDIDNPIVKQRIEYGTALLDLKDKIEEMKPGGQPLVSKLLNVIGLPKTVATGILHFSAIGVQAWGMISHRVTWEAFGEQIKYFADEQNYRDLQAYIISHPDYQFAVTGKLGLTDISDNLSAREEAIQSSILQNFNTYLAEKGGQVVGSDKALPINLVGASSRAFTGFLNYTRFNRFVDLLNAARSVSEDPLKADSQVVKDLASVVNNFTGRANLGEGEKFANTQVVLNSIFFAPRKLGATVQMFNPIEYTLLTRNAVRSGNWTAVQAATRQLTGSIMATGALLYVANAVGYSVNFNPAAQDFLKIHTPSGEKMDVTGGNTIYARLWARIILNKKITSSGKEEELGEGYRPTTRADLALEFLRGKLSPAGGMLADFMYGQDQVGRPFDVPTELRDRMEPIVMENFLNYYEQNPHKAVSDLPILSGIFGVNVESPLPPPTRNGMNVWGEPQSSWHDPQKTELDQQMENIGYVPKFPGKTINGVKLTEDQQKMYQVLSGTYSKLYIDNYMNSQGWNKMSQGQQRELVKGLVKAAQTQAQSAVMLRSRYTSNDIVQKSLDNQKAKYMAELADNDKATTQ